MSEATPVRFVFWGVACALLALAPISAQDSAPVLGKPSEESTSFLRFSKGKTVARLETAIAEYEDLDTGRRVALIASLHVADAEYYRRIQRELERYDVVFFEGVRGDDDALMADVELLTKLQKALQGILGLEYQGDVLKPSGDRYVRADLDAATIRRLLDERGIPLLPYGDLLRNLGPIAGTALELLQRSDPEGRIARRLRDRLKRAIAELLTKGPRIYSLLRRNEDRLRDEVIIGARNRVVVDRVRESWSAASPPRSVGILYGAGHMRDLEARLKKTFPGLSRVELRWLPAWTIGARKPSKKSRKL